MQQDYKTKTILFSGKKRSKDDKLKISRGQTEVAEHKEIEYLGCLFDEKCNGELVSNNWSSEGYGLIATFSVAVRL